MSSQPQNPHLGVVDRFLPVWILSAMALGILLGKVIPGLQSTLDSVKIAGVSLPIALGLLWMMYPVLARVKFDRAARMFGNTKLLVTTSVLNWIVGPLLMFTLAWTFLPDEPAYRTGLILIGLARCIAMVLIWNMLACGDGEMAAVLVAINSVFQIIMYSVLGWFLLSELPQWLGLDSSDFDVSMGTIALNVGIFLGVPLVAGLLSRIILTRTHGEAWYEHTYLKKIGPTALLGLLYTIVLMFAMQGEQIIERPQVIVQIAIPLLFYFVLMFFIAFFFARWQGFNYEETTAIAFTAAGNNFELAIAVAIGLFGITSGEALAGVIGPLIEVPVLVALVYVALWMRDRFFPSRLQGAPA